MSVELDNITEEARQAQAKKAQEIVSAYLPTIKPRRPIAEMIAERTFIPSFYAKPGFRKFQTKRIGEFSARAIKLLTDDLRG